jgi:ABC-type transport system substrate-binding protein
MFLWYGSKSVLNWFSYKNATVDAALKQFATPLSQGAKRTLSLKVQTQLNQDVPMISLGEANFLLPMRSNINNFYYEPDGLLTYRYFTGS